MTTPADPTDLTTAPLAVVKMSCGRQYLSVAGLAVAMEGDRCRDSHIPEGVLPPIPAEELAEARIGDKPASELPIEVVRFFRGDNWTPAMLEYVADKINAARCSPPADVREAARLTLERYRDESDCSPECQCEVRVGRTLAAWVAGLGRTGGASP